MKPVAEIIKTKETKEIENQEDAQACEKTREDHSPEDTNGHQNNNETSFT